MKLTKAELKQLIKEEIEETEYETVQGTPAQFENFIAREQVGTEVLYTLGDQYIKLINKHGMDPESAKESIIFQANRAIERDLDRYLLTLKPYLKQKQD